MDHWYAVYTKPRSEKKLAIKLLEKGIESYLPLRKTLKQWSDRKKLVEEPLISSYVFVNVGPDHYFDVLSTPGAVRYIWFNGKPAKIPANQIQILKLITGSDLEIECLPGYMTKGSQVKILTGPLKNLTGELISHSGKNKILVRIDHLDKVLMLATSAYLVEPISSN